MVIEVINLSSIALQWRQTPTSKHHQPFDVLVALHIKHSFAETDRKTIIPEHQHLMQQKSITILFQNISSMSFQNDNDDVKIQIKCCSRDVECIIAVANIKIKDFLEKQYLDIKGTNDQNDFFRLKYKIANNKLKEKGFLTLKNIQCESLLLSNSSEQYQLEIKCGYRFYRSCRELFHLFWQNEFRMFIENQQEMLAFSVVDSNGKISKLIEVSLKIFKNEKGSKKIFITNENNFPVGCLQFDYEAIGFFSMKNESSIHVQPNQMFKIYIGNLIAKFKTEYDSFYTKIISGVSNLQKICLSEKSNKFQIVVNNYIYSEKQGCTFMVICKQNGNDVLGFAQLNLTMLGKFQQRIKILNSKNKKQMGIILAEVQALKLPIKTLTICKLSLKIKSKIGSNHQSSKVYINAKLGGVFGKTQIKSIQDRIDFSKCLQISFTKQQMLLLNVVDQLNEQIGIQIDLLELQKSKYTFFQKTFGSYQTFIEGSLWFQFNFLPTNCPQNNAPLIKNDQTSNKIDLQIKKTKNMKEQEKQLQTKIQIEKRSTQEHDVYQQNSQLHKPQQQKKLMIKETTQKMYLNITKKRARQVILNHVNVAQMEKHLNKKHDFQDTKPTTQFLNQAKNKHIKNRKMIQDQVKLHKNHNELISPKQNLLNRDLLLLQTYMGRRKNFRIYSKQKIIKSQRTSNKGSNTKRQSVDSNFGMYQVKGKF